MKTRRLTILIVCMIFALSGCALGNKNLNSGDFNDLRESEKTILLERMNEPESFETEQSVADFNVHAEVNLSVDEYQSRIVYNVIVDKPKIAMDDVVISFHLAKGMETKLITNDVFFTNRNGGENTLTDLVPEGDIKGTTAFRGFILDKNLIDQEFLNLFKKMYIHISWTDSGKHKEKFIFVEAEVKKRLKDFLSTQKAGFGRQRHYVMNKQ